MGEIFNPPLIQAQSWQEAQRKFNEALRQMARMLNNITTGAGIRVDRYKELRNTYVFSDQDSLDASYPFEMDFEIVSEMIAINSIKLSFRIREFRAYSTTVPSGGGHTTPSGGGHTTPSGGGSTSGSQGAASGGGSTSGSQTHNHSGSTAGESGYHNHLITVITPAGGYSTAYVQGNGSYLQLSCTDHQGNLITNSNVAGHTHSLNISADGAHTHSTPNHTHPGHTHTTPNHTHTVSNHTHTVSNHTHGLTFGIYEDSQSPTLHYHIDNGSGYGGASSNYTTDQIDLAITTSISGTGYKRIKFDSDVRCRISAWVMCKVDLIA